MTSLHAFFPKRAIRLKHPVMVGFMRLLVLLPLYAIWVTYNLSGAVSSFYDDVYLRDRGTLARSVRLELGSGCTHHNFKYNSAFDILAVCELDMTYTTAEGTYLQKHVEIASLLQSIDFDVPLEIRYDPADPTRISTNWGASLLVNRIAAPILVLALLISCTALGIFGTMRFLRLVIDKKAAGQNPTPIAVQLTKATKVRGRLYVSYCWQDPKTGQPRSGSVNLTKPFWLNTEKTNMLALLSPTGKAYLLDADLNLTDLTKAEKAGVMKLSHLF